MIKGMTFFSSFKSQNEWIIGGSLFRQAGLPALLVVDDKGNDFFQQF